MPLLTISNLTRQRLGLNRYTGSLGPLESRTFDLKIQEMEDSQPMLVTLVTAGTISFSVTQDAETLDNAMEPALGGGTVGTGVVIVTGSGSPDGSVEGTQGSLYIDLDGPAIYLNESGGTAWAVVTTTT